jgi:hypothetical protein
MVASEKEGDVQGEGGDCKCMCVCMSVWDSRSIFQPQLVPSPAAVICHTIHKSRSKVTHNVT